MLSFVQSWFSPASSPIGVDLGSDCLRMAQVEQMNNEFHLVAAASADVPTHVRNDPAARFNFFAEVVRDLLAQGNFRGRRVMLNLPASMMHIQHLRLPKMDDEAMKKALAWEARGKLPFDPSQAVLRHLIAGEIYHDQEPKYEVVLMAARRDLVEQLLAAANKARLQVAGMNVEPKAIVDCFSQLFHRPSDIEAVTCFVDIGCTATRAVIARGGRILFARVVPIGGEHFSRAVATSLQIPLEDARLLRVRLATGTSNLQDKTEVLPGDRMLEQEDSGPADRASPSAAADADPMEGTGFALLNAAVAAAERREPTRRTATDVEAAPIERHAASEAAGASHPDRRRVEQACGELLSRLVEELALCRRYYEAAFHEQPVQRLIFVGGEANQRALCQQIARELGVAAQIGDPLARMGKFSDAVPPGGIDRRLPQPAWTVAMGLSMGPRVNQEQAAKQT